MPGVEQCGLEVAQLSSKVSDLSLHLPQSQRLLLQLAT